MSEPKSGTVVMSRSEILDVEEVTLVGFVISCIKKNSSAIL